MVWHQGLLVHDTYIFMRAEGDAHSHSNTKGCQEEKIKKLKPSAGKKDLDSISPPPPHTQESKDCTELYTSQGQGPDSGLHKRAGSAA